MLTLFFAPRTRAVRIAWLLEELNIPYQLERVAFVPPAKEFFAQATPTGKVPTIVDGDVVLCESGAIVEYILQRYGKGRLAPVPSDPQWPTYLQWLHFAESTAFPPLGIVVWLSRYRHDQDPELLADAKLRAVAGLDYLEREFGPGPYLLGEAFTAADIMMGFTLAASAMLDVLGDSQPRLQAYLARLQTRPALQKVMALD